MLTIGCHLSTTKGYRAMGETALSIGANTFAFFTRNPRGGKAKAMIVTPSRLHAVRYLLEFKRQIKEKGSVSYTHLTLPTT